MHSGITMVQKSKDKLTRNEPGLKIRESRAQLGQGFRKSAPVQRKRTVQDKVRVYNVWL